MNLDADIDSDIRAAIAKTSETETPATDDADGGTSISADPGVLESAAPIGTGGPGEATQSSTAPMGGPESTSRARGPDGKFVKGQATATKAPEVAAQTQTKAAPAQAAASSTGVAQNPSLASGDSSPRPVAAIRPPQALTEQEREHFAKAPPEIQKAILRIDQSARQAMQESAPARRFVQEVAQVLEPIARTRGISPGQLISNYAQADTMLSAPDQRMKAEAIGRLADSYGLDDDGIAALDEYLVKRRSGGVQPRQLPQQPHFNAQQLVSQTKAELLRDLKKEQAENELRNFMADNSNHFLHGEKAPEVLQEMFGHMQAAEALGRPITFAQAYQKALWSNEETRSTLQETRDREAANATQASTQRARAAAVSVKSQPAPAPNGQAKDDLDSTIRAAFAQARNR